MKGSTDKKIHIVKKIVLQAKKKFAKFNNLYFAKFAKTT